MGYSSGECRFHNMWRVSLVLGLLLLMVQYTSASPTSESVPDSLDATEKVGAPLIIPPDPDVVIDVYTNYTLLCRSERPVTWRIPRIHNMIEYTITPVERPDSSLPFGSTLFLNNVTVDFVGKYYCIETEFDSTEDSNLDILITLYQAETVYVYVNDPEHLLAPIHGGLVFAKQYADAIIPCKPANKNTEVELLKGDESALTTKNRYDPTVGYTIIFTELTETGHFLCRTSNSNIPEKIDLNVHLLESDTDHINAPTIMAKNNGHVIEGETLTLECSVDVMVSVQFRMNWSWPNKKAAEKEGRVIIANTTKTVSDYTNNLAVGRTELIVQNVGQNDSGYYTCEVEDHLENENKGSRYVTVLRPGESYINMSEPTDHYTITISAKKKPPIKMLVKYKAHPEPAFTWYNNNHDEIKHNEKYEIVKTDVSIMLKIYKFDISDTGEYTLKAYNGDIEKELKFMLHVKDKPIVKMQEVHYVQTGEEVQISCECAAYPKSQISWSWTPCQIKPKWPNCFPANSTKFQFKEMIMPEDINMLEDLENDSYRTKEVSILVQQSDLKFTPDKPGFVKCFAQNSEGNDTSETTILLGDLNESFTIYGIDDNHLIAVGDDVNITCGVLAYSYSGDIEWYRNDSLIETGSDWQVEYSESEYSYKKKLIMKNVGYDKSGIYECQAYLINNTASESRLITLKVHEPKAPIIISSNLDQSQIGKRLGERLHLECKYNGLPEPVISWYKDDVRLQFAENDSRHSLDNHGSSLSILLIEPDDEGNYKCVVSNRLGSAEKSATVRISNMPGLRLPSILGIVGLFIVLILLIIYLCIRFCREKKLRKALKAAGLANFEEGSPDHINPALSLDEQADLLPYDRNFEFPKEKLKLGKQLGAGAFGVVLKASAEEIMPNERETTVAVKMVKKTADNEVMRALVSELKIMVHLGRHLNVVNLLGAVTKNIAKREVMIIVEYCRFGNLQNFLLKNRKNYINQINPKTDEIDLTILTKEMRMSGDYEINSRSHDGSNENYVRQSGADYIGQNINSGATEMTTIPGEESIILSNNSIQPAWRSNYKSDVTTSMEITTKHLISWAFQVARGMDYLSSRKVLHGDLAARNILLCEDNIVKICDFGLARSMYRSSNYKKHGEAPLPIKWLALESMSDQIFSTASDIWSYGIVLWEFFSLAKVPYPGMDADETLYLKLKDGYRMEKPEYANQELYDIMLECWSTNPEMRPPFAELEKRFARMLGEDVTNHYIDLNDTYLKMNSDYFKAGKIDYLAMMGCPDEPAPQPPRYVNGKLLSEMTGNSPTAGDYLQMNSKSGDAIFSPRIEDARVRGDHFTFPTPISPTISHHADSPSSKNRNRGAIPEEVPMLNRSGGSDSESEHSPDVIISSPSKQFASLNKSHDPKTGVIGNDNYVNVQGSSDINKLRTKDAFSNPEYLMLKNVNEKRK